MDLSYENAAQQVTEVEARLDSWRKKEGIEEPSPPTDVLKDTVLEKVSKIKMTLDERANSNTGSYLGTDEGT